MIFSLPVGQQHSLLLLDLFCCRCNNRTEPWFLEQSQETLDTWGPWEESSQSHCSLHSIATEYIYLKWLFYKIETFTSACALSQSSLRSWPDSLVVLLSYSFKAKVILSLRSVVRLPFAATQEAAIMQMKMTRRMLKKVMSMHLFSFQAPQHPRNARIVMKIAKTTNSPAAVVNLEISELISSQSSPHSSEALWRICRNHGLSARAVIPHPKTAKPRI